MARYWQIRESFGEKGMNPEVKEAYECGYDEGYEAAMEEIKKSGMMGERSHYGMRGEGMGMRGEDMGMRFGMRSGGDGSFGERRGRYR